MKKSDIVECVAGEGAMTKLVAEASADGVFAAVAESLAAGEDMTVVGFGRFSRRTRPTREGRNPRTGVPVAIGPSATVSFKPVKALKDTLN